jgi:hypothetical protein
MFATIFSSIAAKWLFRRVLEIGGIAGSGLGWYMSLSPATQALIANLLQHNWDKVSLAALLPLAVSLWGYVWSFISTTRAHVVADGQSKPIKALPVSTQEAVKSSMRATKTTLAEKLAGIFGR